MSTILMRTDLLADARVLRIVSITRVDRMRVIGALYWLWSTAQTQSTDGVIQCLNEDIIDDQVSLPGFAKAAVAVGWLVLGDDTATVPDFDSYFGRSAKTRAKERLKKARQRWSKPPNATDMGEGQTGDKEGTQSGQHRDTSEQRIGLDRIGLDRIGADPIQSPTIASATGSADRFIANRTIATGNAPPGFVAFYNAYPTGYKSDHDGLLALWTGQGLEERSANIIDGLKQWLACERWQQGFVVEAKKFIETRKWRDTPPPPKPVTDRHGKPVTPPKPGPEKLDTAGQAAFKAWWRALDPGGQAAFAQAKGVAVSVVNENVNWQRVPAAWGDAIGEGKQRSTA